MCKKIGLWWWNCQFFHIRLLVVGRGTETTNIPECICASLLLGLGHKLQMDYRMTLRRLQLKYYWAYLHLIFLNYYLGWGTTKKRLTFLKQLPTSFSSYNRVTLSGIQTRGHVYTMYDTSSGGSYWGGFKGLNKFCCQLPKLALALY